MTYDQTIEYLFGQLPMYQRSGVAAYKDNLDNTLALDEMFGHPHRKFKCIHVAGTNGKGSVSHWLASVLQSAGYKVGLYTSPHLRDYRERIKVNGEMISREAVTSFVERFLAFNKEKNIAPSFFELSVLMAFDYFAAENVDIAVIEVGLGGRLDSTNIITPEVSVITNISLDHTNLLGNTIEKIAGEKAGIIKKGVPAVIGETQEETTPVFQQKAEEMHSPIFFADQNYLLLENQNGSYNVTSECQVIYRNIKPGLKGAYQHNNIITVLAAIHELKKCGFQIDEVAVSDGLRLVVEYTGLEGRWQQLGENPKIICDSGHNEAGINWVVSQLEKEFCSKLHVVFGTVNDKDIRKILKLLPTNAIYYFCQANIARALNAKELQQNAKEIGLTGQAFNSVSEAFNSAKENAKPNDLIFVGGSTFVVAEVI